MENCVVSLGTAKEASFGCRLSQIYTAQKCGSICVVTGAKIQNIEFGSTKNCCLQ